MFPREYLGSITRRSHKYPTACSPRASTKLGSLSLASSGHFHTPRPGGRRFPPPRFRSAPPPPASPSTPRRRCSAPRPPASGAARRLSDAFSFSCFFGVPHHTRRASPHASGPPRIPQRRCKEAHRVRLTCRQAAVARAATSGRYGVKCCPRHSRRFLRVCVRASLRRSVQLGHSCGIT
jgi:hypothetical protein